MIDADFVQKIVDISQVHKFELPADLSKDGEEHHFTNQKLFEIIPAAPPLLAGVIVTTLQGFADVIGQKIDELKTEEWFIQTVTPSLVALNNKTTDAWGRRQTLVTAKPVEFEQFQFARWYAQEEFLIKMASLFSPTEDLTYVIQVAGNLTSDASDTREDDGFTQRATVRAGMKPRECVTIRPSVVLAPYRYFPECQVVASAFVFRAIQEPDKGPMLALFEADGGRWKVAAIQEVARFLRTLNIEGIEIVA
jgi:hypothetical protein